MNKGQALFSPREIRLLVGRICRELALPAGANVLDFLGEYGRRRGLRLKMIAVNISPGDDRLFGFYMATELWNLIVYRENTSWLHQNRILAHEGGHLILGHAPRTREAVLGGGAGERTLAQEAAAEFFAACLLERLTKGVPGGEQRRMALQNRPEAMRLEEFFRSFR